ncbi:MAG: hypothetical protein K0S63_290 [Gammaproteobacteria bacterium]|nr:hypothetical protein [Gammaproteobacteria bacterium]
MFLFILSAFNFAIADESIGQVLQINTRFLNVYGKPTWLLIVRDEETGRVLPYLFDIREKTNFWIAFTYGHTYKVTASNLVFGPYAKVKNFCHLEKGILTGQSMFITLKGVLAPTESSFKCYVQQYAGVPFTIASELTRT